jgi:hypothetical protein
MFTIYTGTSSAFQVGVVGGAVLSFDRLHFFIERASNIRRFANIQWVGTSSSNRIPKKLPNPLDFSGRTVSAGVQFTIRNK